MPRRIISLHHGPDPAAMGLRIRDERLRLGLTQAAAAAELGISRGRMRDLEERANPQLSTLCALVDVLGMDPRALVPELSGPQARPRPRK